jgi:hypothetical protein
VPAVSVFELGADVFLVGADVFVVGADVFVVGADVFVVGTDVVVLRAGVFVTTIAFFGAAFVVTGAFATVFVAEVAAFVGRRWPLRVCRGGASCDRVSTIVGVARWTVAVSCIGGSNTATCTQVFVIRDEPNVDMIKRY